MENITQDRKVRSPASAAKKSTPNPPSNSTISGSFPPSIEKFSGSTSRKSPQHSSAKNSRSQELIPSGQTELTNFESEIFGGPDVTAFMQDSFNFTTVCWAFGTNIPMDPLIRHRRLSIEDIYLAPGQTLSPTSHMFQLNYSHTETLYAVQDAVQNSYGDLMGKWDTFMDRALNHGEVPVCALKNSFASDFEEYLTLS